MTSVIKTTFGSGGAPMSPTGSDGPTLAQAFRDLADDLASVRAALGVTKANGSGVIEGCWLATPTLASSQAAGVGNTDWNVNIDAGKVEVNGVYYAYAGATNFDIHSGSLLTGFTVGKSCIAAIVAKNVTGTVTVVAVKGTCATTGSQVAPTDAEIQASVGSGNTWGKIGECTLNRTGDAVVTESQNVAVRDRSAGLGSLALSSLLTKG